MLVRARGDSVLIQEDGTLRIDVARDGSAWIHDDTDRLCRPQFVPVGELSPRYANAAREAFEAQDAAQRKETQK